MMLSTELDNQSVSQEKIIQSNARCAQRQEAASNIAGFAFIILIFVQMLLKNYLQISQCIYTPEML